MIDIKELRVGNIIYGSMDVEMIVDVPYFEMIDSNPALYSPIPLTEEWLKRMGFTLISKHNYYNYVLKNDFILSMWMEDFQVADFEEKRVCYWGEKYTPIRTVHQLQNLYFALFETELEIK